MSTTPSILSAIQKLRSLLTRKEKITWLGIIVFALGTSLLEVVTASVIVIFAQVLTQPEAGQKYLTMAGFHPNLSSGRIVFYVAVIVGAIYLVKNLVAAAEVFYQNFSIQKMNYHFKNKLLQRYAETDYAFFLTRNSSLGMQVVGGDAQQMFSVGMVSLAMILSESMVFLCLIGMIIYMSPYLAITIFVIGGLLGVIISKLLLPRFYRFGQELQEASMYATQNLLQFFHAFKEIILLGKRDFFVSSYQNYSRKIAYIQAMQVGVNSLPRSILEVLFISLFVATIAFLCFEHESPLKIIGILGGYLYAGFRMMPGLSRIINQSSAFKSVIPSIERVHKEYFTVGEKERYINLPEFNFHKNISLQDVSFRYLNTRKDAIGNISFDIKKGECIGIVGETGSGKSTLIDLILGLLKPHTGSILVDGRFTVSSYQWHQKIGYVPQSIYLTDDTIAANIAFGEQEIDTYRLDAAIEAAQLRKFTDKLPHGVSTTVGERGIRLSGGERQRIAIARALYRNPEVLIFDEATSALDTETESRLMETIHAVRQNRTVIMIAHRLTTLNGCDRVITITEGRVYE